MTTYRPIENDGDDVTESRTQGFILAYNTILENQLWHESYDEHGGYPGSDLCQNNETALFFLQKLIRLNQARDRHYTLPTWMALVVGAMIGALVRGLML